MSSAPRSRTAAGTAGVLALALVAALAPLLAHELPLAMRSNGELRFPLLRCLSLEDRVWFGLAALTLGVLAALAPRGSRGRRSALAAGAALCLVVAAACGGGRPRPDELDWRARTAGNGELVVPTLVGFGPTASDDVAIEAGELPARPSARHWLGTDGSGRDLLARLIHGTRVSLGIATTAAAVALAIGLSIGLACGAWRGATDLLLMRVVEVFLCFPQLFLVLIVFAYLPHGRFALALLLGAVGWTTTANVARGEFLRLQGEEFVLAARALGVPAWRLALRHLLPNALGPVLVAATFGVAGALLSEFALSFLGFGVEPPTPSLGAMLAEGKSVLATAPWIALLPGTMIFLVVLCFNALGEALRPRMSAGGGARAPVEGGAARRGAP
jgi:peptide/nickel transport system permease protein